MDINEFIELEKKRLDLFKKHWLEENSKNPEEYPLSFNDENEGIWDEMFSLFVEDNHEKE